MNCASKRELEYAENDDWCPETNKRAHDLQVFPSVYSTWSQRAGVPPDQSRHVPVRRYIAVFCRPITFTLLERVHRLADSSYYPMGMCHGAASESTPATARTITVCLPTPTKVGVYYPV
ncbi:hypothetical protein AAVH_15450, partial [Aphelenchoides avenae]